MEINLIFHILGIETTKNENEIRDAYRNALKYNNPEDNPEGFKELRIAYEEALAYAKSPDEADDNCDDIPPNLSPEVAEWLKKVTDLYHDLPSRGNLSKWDVLLSDELCEGIDTSMEVKEQFLIFLMQHNHFPYEVWKAFDKTFEIIDTMKELEDQFPAGFLNYIKFYIEHPSFLPYTFFSYRNPMDQSCDGDSYIDSYFSIKEKIDNEDTKDCYHLLDRLSAYGVYHPYEDVERCRLYLYSGKTEEAYSILSSIKEQHPDDIYIRLHYGFAVWKNGDHESASNIWKEILSLRPNHYQAQSYLTSYYMEKELFYDAKDSVISMLELDNENKRCLALLEEINSSLIDILSKDLENGNGNDRFSVEEVPIELGWCLFQSQRSEEVITLLKDYTPTTELEYNYCNLYGRVLYQLKRYEEALPYIQKWFSMIEKLEDDGTEETRKRMSRYGMASYVLAECFMELNMLDEAEALLAKASARSTTPMEALEYENHRAELYLKSKKYEQSIDLCDKILATDNSYYPAYVIRQECFFHLYKPQEVVDDYHRAIDIYPGYYKPYMFACEVFLQYNQYEDAKEVLELAEQNQVELTPRMRLDEIKTLRNLSDSKEETTKLFSLLTKLKKEIDTPEFDIEDSSEIYYEIGLVAWDINDLEKAKKMLTKAIEENNNKLQYHMVLGDILIGLELYKDALNSFQKGEQEYSDLPIYHYNLGICYENLNEEDKAISCYEEVLKIEEGYRDCNEKLSDIYYNRFHKLFEHKWLNLALLYATHQLKAADCCYYRVERGLIYMNSLEAEYIELAIEDFEKALEFTPDDWAAWNNIGCCYKYLGEFEKAIPYFEKAASFIKDASPSRLPYGNMADCYEALKDYENAIECYKKNLPNFSNDSSTWEDIGDLLCYLGKDEDAMSAYEKTNDTEIVEREKVWSSLRKANQFQKHRLIRSYLDVYDEELSDRYVNLGNYFFDEVGDYKKAATYYSKALEFHLYLNFEKCFRYEKICALAFYLAKDFEKAKTHANLALEAFTNASYKSEELYYMYKPSLPYRTLSFGIIYLILGEKKKALELFKLANSNLRCKGCRYSKCYEYFYYMGFYYYMENDLTNARIHFDKVLEINPHCTEIKTFLKKFFS